MKTKKIRERLFMTQKEFAKTLGVSLTAVSYWDIEQTEPSLKNKKAIKEICDSNGLKYEDYVE